MKILIRCQKLTSICRASIDQSMDTWHKGFPSSVDTWSSSYMKIDCTVGQVDPNSLWKTLDWRDYGKARRRKHTRTMVQYLRCLVEESHMPVAVVLDPNTGGLWWPNLKYDHRHWNRAAGKWSINDIMIKVSDVSNISQLDISPEGVSRHAKSLMAQLGDKDMPRAKREKALDESAPALLRRQEQDQP